jgi:thioredoxin 1
MSQLCGEQNIHIKTNDMQEVINMTDYENIIKGNKPVLLDFYADWCGPCQTQLPIVEGLATKHETDFVIAKVNVDKNKELAHKFGVRSIPALFFVENREIKERLVGLHTTTTLDKKIHTYLK